MHGPSEIGYAPLPLTTLKPPVARLTRSEVAEVIAHGSPSDIISSLSREPRLGELFASSTRVREGYSVAEHTEMVLGQQQKYGLGSSLQLVGAGEDLVLDEKFLRSLLTLHDLGKFYPETPHEGPETGKDAQHQRTLAVVDHFAPLFFDTQWHREVAKAVIGSDRIGALLKRVASDRLLKEDKERLRELGELAKNDPQHVAAFGDGILHLYDKVAMSSIGPAQRLSEAREVAREIQSDALRFGLNPHQFLALYLLYYQADCSSYSCDGESVSRRGAASLEFLFATRPLRGDISSPLLVRDEERDRLSFRGIFEETCQAMEGFVA